MQHLKYLITGTGHSGTQWAASVAAHCGLRAGHEVIFQGEGREINVGGIPWECEVSALAAPFLDRVPQGIKVIHLTRHPVDTIRSLALAPGGSWPITSRDWVERCLGRKLPGEKISYLIEFYLGWVDLIERSHHTVEVVHLEDGHEALCAALDAKEIKKEIRPLGAKAPKDALPWRWSHLGTSDRVKTLYNRSLTLGYIPYKTTHHTASFNESDSPKKSVHAAVSA